jgi:hypothetical protein
MPIHLTSGVDVEIEIKRRRLDEWCQNHSPDCEIAVPSCGLLKDSPATLRETLNLVRSRSDTLYRFCIFIDMCRNCRDHESMHVNRRCLTHPTHFVPMDEPWRS